MRVMLILAAALTPSACATPPRPAQQQVTGQRPLSSFVHPGDSVTYAEPLGDNSFCVTSVSGDDIHSTGPLTIQASKVQNLRVRPKDCVHDHSLVRDVGQVAGGLVLTPFVLVCMSVGGCDMR